MCGLVTQLAADWHRNWFKKSPPVNTVDLCMCVNWCSSEVVSHLQEVSSTSDSQRGSVLALLIAVVIIFALVNVDKVGQVMHSTQSLHTHHIQGTG